jgi:hypothetical protein
MLSRIKVSGIRKTYPEFVVRVNSRFFSSKPEQEQSESQEESAEQSSSKDLANPITWPNPTGGPSQEEKTPAYWKWVYPVGSVLIIGGFWLAGRKKEKTEKNKKLKETQNLNSTFSPPPSKYL